MYYYLLAFLLACAVNAWLPRDRSLTAFNQSVRFEKLGKRFEPQLPNGITKIRGVNFGGWLIAEPWLMENEWRAMRCNPDLDHSEFDCMLNHYMGNNCQSGNDAFQKHWEEWIDANTVQSVYDVGLNTIRIPIGYWSYTEIVDKTTEPFANGDNMLPYLDNVVQRATDLGMYVVIDFHGAPGAQQQDAFTGQLPNQAGFFDDYNFDRACKWLTWMANRIHSHPAYASVGMIGVLNEPVSMHDPDNRYPAPGQVPGLVETYYPRALKAVRDAEMEVPDERKLHVQFMSRLWDSGDPRTSSSVRNDPMVAFDDHNYIGFIPTITNDEDSLMHNACTGSRLVDGENFKITGEWSMTSDIDWHNADFSKCSLPRNNNFMKSQVWTGGYSGLGKRS